MPLKFSVMGSADNKYTIIADRTEDNLTITCSCPAGQKRTYCKHRMALLDGDVGLLLSENLSDVERLRLLAAGTDVEKYCASIRMLEAKKARVDHLLKTEKKTLARAMHD